MENTKHRSTKEERKQGRNDGGRRNRRQRAGGRCIPGVSLSQDATEREEKRNWGFLRSSLSRAGGGWGEEEKRSNKVQRGKFKEQRDIKRMRHQLYPYRYRRVGLNRFVSFERLATLPLALRRPELLNTELLLLLLLQQQLQ